MNTLVNPTKEQVIEFCKFVEEQLLAAIDRGSVVEIGKGQVTKDIKTPEYGNTVVDAFYIGAVFKASFRERGF